MVEKKVYLLSSPIMPNEGEYCLKNINYKQYIEEIKIAQENNKLISCITHQDNLNLINKSLNSSIPSAKDQNTNKKVYKTIFQPGDKALIMKLKTRISPEEKGKIIERSPVQYEYFILDFK